MFSNLKSSGNLCSLAKKSLSLTKPGGFISSNKEVKRNNENILKNPEINLEVGQEYIDYLLNLKTIDNNLIFLTPIVLRN